VPFTPASKGTAVRQCAPPPANTVEGYFSILKRGIMGTFHHVSKQHLGRYLDEFDFRYNARDTSDGERAELAVKGVVGKRLMYRDSYLAL